MSLGAEIALEALDAGLLLSRKGDKVHFDSPLGHPLPDALRARILTHKQEVLAWLDFRESADELLLSCFARLSVRAQAPAAEAWSRAEETLQAGYRSGDIEVFRTALDEYERLLYDEQHSPQHHESEER